MTPLAELTTCVIVNFNGGPALHRCVQSLMESAPGCHVFVVDNASTDGSTENIDPQVRVIRNEKNAGYAAAINQAAQLSSRPFLVASNMDIVFEDHWLEPLVHLLNEREDAGAVSPLILLTSGDAINAAGQNIHVTGLGFNRALGSQRKPGGEAVRVGGIHGALFAMRRSVWSEIGGLDESGFLYHEDVNLSWTLRLRSYELYCVPASVVRHDYFLSMDPEKFFLLERNRVALLMTHLRIRTILALAPFLLATEAMAWGFSFLRGAAFMRAKAASYAWLVRQRSRWSDRRKWMQKLRRQGDWRVLSRLSWNYDLHQFFVLARERGEPRRRINRDGLPGGNEE